MARLFVMTGIPGSGKSYHSKKIAERENAKIYSSDLFRAHLKMDASNDLQNDTLFDMMYAAIRRELDQGQDIVLDATNTYAKYRRKIFRAVEGSNAELICVLVMRRLENCLEANRQRKNPIREEVILNMYRDYDLPYYNEPWDRIEVIYPDNDETSLGYYLDDKEKYMDFPHDNPHHAETLGVHINLVMEKLRGADERLIVAAALHDCGKPYTKSFVNAKGEVTPIAHYYMHEHVGSYMTMFYDFGNHDMEYKLYIAFLVAMHMRPFVWEKSEKAKNRDQRTMKKEWIVSILQLHEADIKSSIPVR